MALSARCVAKVVDGNVLPPLLALLEASPPALVDAALAAIRNLAALGARRPPRGPRWGAADAVFVAGGAQRACAGDSRRRGPFPRLCGF